MASIAPYCDSELHGDWACTTTQRSVDIVQLSHGPEVLTPTFVGHIHPLPPCKDRSPLSRALNPLQSAPLQHINSGTGTNCPTLDVLETHIASAASMPQTPQHSTPNRRKPSKEESQNCWFLCPVFLVKQGSSLQRLHLFLCVTVNVHLFKLVLKTSPSLLTPWSRFLSCYSAMAWFSFYSCETTDK